MDILFLLIPLAAALVLVIIAVFGWAVHQGQFDDLEHEGVRILGSDVGLLDIDQTQAKVAQEQSPQRQSDQARSREGELDGQPERCSSTGV